MKRLTVKKKKKEYKYSVPGIPEEWINLNIDPEKIYIYWETHREELTFIKEFIRDGLLNDREYLCIVWDKTLHPDYDNGWTKIWVLTYILKQYTELVINDKKLPSDLSKIGDLLDILDEDCSQRDICKKYDALKNYISRTYGLLRNFYMQKRIIIGN